MSQTALSPRSPAQGTDSAVTADPAALASIPPGTPPPSSPSATNVTLTPSGCISTRTRRRTVTAAGAAQPAVNYCSEPGVVSRSSTPHIDTQQHALFPRSRSAVATGPLRAPSSVPTGPISSDCDQVESWSALLFRLPIPSEPPCRST